MKKAELVARRPKLLKELFSHEKNSFSKAVVRPQQIREIYHQLELKHHGREELLKGIQQYLEAFTAKEKK